MFMKLIKLSEEYKYQLGQMIDEWKLDQIENNTNKSPSAIFKNDYKDFEKYLQNLETLKPTSEKVPESVFFLLDEQKNKLIGAITIRHYLNDFLLKEGGHIGYGIRPSERRKGYAKLMLKLALKECKKLGLNKVLIVCDKDNIGSSKTIINNGGILENEIGGYNGELISRYWIDIII